jgi:hypothetical protein
MTARLEKALKELPPDAIDQITRLAESMVAMQSTAQEGKFELKWAGALAHLADKFDSVQLQHEANRWRIAESTE